MTLMINGKEEFVTDGINVTELLKEKQVRMPEMVSVELNGDILNGKSFQSQYLKEGDAVEFLYFMGGGK
ncbi:MAG: sulfur carrier protein ThiS [bacterium]|nr:sulfur carrier protein ThiS [bacterium]